MPVFSFLCVVVFYVNVQVGIGVVIKKVYTV